MCVCVCVCRRAEWFEKWGEGMISTSGGIIPILMDDNNVDVASVSVGDRCRRSSVFVNLLMTKETNVSSACEGTEGALVFFGFRFRRWSSGVKGRGGKAGRGRERMVPLLSHSMILPLIVAARLFLHIFLAFTFSLFLARFH